MVGATGGGGRGSKCEALYNRQPTSSLVVEESAVLAMVQFTGAQYPVPTRRTLVVDLSTKTSLVQSFERLTSSSTTVTQMRLARQCIAAIGHRSTRYEHVPFHMILQWNKVIAIAKMTLIYRFYSTGIPGILFECHR